MMLFQEETIKVRVLTEEDALLLTKWLSDKRVLEFYEGRDRPHDLELVRKHFFEDRDNISQCIIQYNEKDIGYIQFYPITDEEREKYGYIEENEEIYGMDQFIGEVDCWNKGIGSELVKATVHYILRERNANKIVMDPQAWNTRALRCYEKCGFIKKKYLEKHELHEGQYRDCWLIEYSGK
jgi:aminoglycoside 6'-N-acetyltransferase